MSVINKIKKNHLCLGCGLCEAIDNNNCKMELTKEGFYEPIFKDSSLIKDNIIKSVCPAVTVHAKTSHSHKTIWGDVVSVSNAWAKDKEIRHSSSSGGVTSALAIYLLESKKVDGVLQVRVADSSYLYNKLYISNSSFGFGIQAV